MNRLRFFHSIVVYYGILKKYFSNFYTLLNKMKQAPDKTR